MAWLTNFIQFFWFYTNHLLYRLRKLRKTHFWEVNLLVINVFLNYFVRNSFGFFYFTIISKAFIPKVLTLNRFMLIKFMFLSFVLRAYDFLIKDVANLLEKRLSVRIRYLLLENLVLVEMRVLRILWACCLLLIITREWQMSQPKVGLGIGVWIFTCFPKLATHVYIINFFKIWIELEWILIEIMVVLVVSEVWKCITSLLIVLLMVHQQVIVNFLDFHNIMVLVLRESSIVKLRHRKLR